MVVPNKTWSEMVSVLDAVVLDMHTPPNRRWPPYFLAALLCAATLATSAAMASLSPT